MNCYPSDDLERRNSVILAKNIGRNLNGFGEDPYSESLSNTVVTPIIAFLKKMTAAAGRAHTRLIYYMGFNGHLQMRENDSTLSFPTLTARRCQIITNEESPPDRISTPTRLSLPNETFSIVATFWSSTVLRDSQGFWHLGYRSHGNDPCRIDLEEGLEVEDIKGFFGDLGGTIGAVTHSGKLLALKEMPESQSMRLERCHRLCRSLTGENDGDAISVRHVVVAGNDQVCVAVKASHKRAKDDGWAVHVFANSRAVFDGDASLSKHGMSKAVSCITAAATAFALLLEDGCILTFGSRLQPALLARSPTPDLPAEVPCPVEQLSGIPIQKVVMDQWLGAALSIEQDLYVWGGRAGETLRINALPEHEEDVMLADIDDGADIVDVSLGMGHILAVTAQGSVWACGDNKYGQIGLRPRDHGFAPYWSKVEVPGLHDETSISLSADGWGSWITVEAGLIVTDP